MFEYLKIEYGLVPHWVVTRDAQAIKYQAIISGLVLSYCVEQYDISGIWFSLWFSFWLIGWIGLNLSVVWKTPLSYPLWLRILNAYHVHFAGNMGRCWKSLGKILAIINQWQYTDEMN